MSGPDVVQVRGRGVRTAAGAVVAFVTGGSPGVTVTDVDDQQLFHVDKKLLDHWYARTPAGEALLRIDWSLGSTHPLTFADGRTARFDGAPEFGAWELTDAPTGRLLVHARRLGVTGFDWECAQDGSLTLLDLLAAVVTYRELLRLQREHVHAAEAFS